MKKKKNTFLIRANEVFRKFASNISTIAGSPWAFCLAVLTVVVWASFGPYYKWSSEHSLFINSFTTIITFLMVFLVQASQNRDSKVMLLKMDAILAALDNASNRLIDLENQSDEVVDQAIEEIKSMRED